MTEEDLKSIGISDRFKIKPVEEWPNSRWHNVTLDQLGPLKPEAEDESVIFRHNWLAIGQAFGLVASSGVGKSSMMLQMACHWSLGDPFLAEPIRPLDISVIQAEDSNRDLQEQRDGMIRGMTDEGYSLERINRAISAIKFPTDFIGLQGDDFLSLLREYQADCRFNLLIINPLQRFFGGNISEQENASHFCAGLDKILKNEDYGCTAGIVMHTPKFHSGVRDGRQSVDDYAEYAMAGSQEWTAWIRAVINFQKHGNSDDYFDVKASKRGKRLGWKDANGNPTTKRIFRHSDGFIYWQEVTDPEEIAGIPSGSAVAEKRKPKAEMDLRSAAVYWANQIADRADLQQMGTHNLRDAIYGEIRKNGRSRYDARQIFNALMTNPGDFGLRISANQFGKKILVPNGDFDDQF